MSGMQSIKAKLDANKPQQAGIEIVRASKLAEEGRTGSVAAGVFEKSEPNKFNAAKLDYFIRGEDGTLYIVNETKSLREQMDELKGLEGTKVEIVYNGKKDTKSGRGWHDFEVFAKA